MRQHQQQQQVLPMRRQVTLRAAAQQQQQQTTATPQQHSSPQPLADISLGAGRLASQLVQSITNPKEDKDLAKKRKDWQRKQDEEKAREEADKQHHQQQQELEQQAAAAALTDPLGLAEAAQEAGAEAVAAADAVVADAAAAAAAAAVPEAVVAAGQHSIVSEYTEELVVEEPRTLQQTVADARAFLTTTPSGKGITIAAGLFLGATLGIALFRTYQKYSSPRAQRMRVIDKNKLLVAELSQYLPDNRAGLTPGVIKKLRGSTGFTPVEVFRKYLWFLLRERQFDAAAVEDMTLLKNALGLSDDEVSEALRERASRIYDKYGTLMLNTDGMTAEGLERKATCRALFSKLLYLTEHEPLVAPGSDAFNQTDLRTIFGATDEDVSKLRIVSLYEMDLEKMESLMAGGGAAAGAAAQAAADAAADAAAADTKPAADQQQASGSEEKK